MTPTEVTEILRHLDGWPVQSHSCKKVQEAIDAAVEMIERLEGAERSLDCYQSERKEAAELFLVVKTKLIAERAALLDRIEEADKEVESWKGLAQQFGNEADALQAKIEAMEKQEPVKYERRIKRRSEHTWGHWRECYKVDYVKAKAVGGHYPKFSDDLFDYEMRPLYALPGVKGE